MLEMACGRLDARSFRPKTPATDGPPSAPRGSERRLAMAEGYNRPPSGVEVGPDVVLYFGEKIVVCAAKEMPEWESKESTRPAIEFEEQQIGRAHV